MNRGSLLVMPNAAEIIYKKKPIIAHVMSEKIKKRT